MRLNWLSWLAGGKAFELENDLVRCDLILKECAVVFAGCALYYKYNCRRRKREVVFPEREEEEADRKPSKRLRTSGSKRSRWHGDVERLFLRLSCYSLLVLLNWELLKGGSEGLLLLLTDRALVEDPKFRPYVEA
ncbi:hypothetical protein R1flu_024816 [Riccia fluitans]|uniref:Uncharacterized protein n=1 Tax=Riccia fluitans TaxID=41844 RepID=A0ABD1XWG3_9MARC